MSESTVSQSQDGEEWGTGLVAFVQGSAQQSQLREDLARLKRSDAQVLAGGLTTAAEWCEVNLPPQVLLVDLDGEKWPLTGLEALMAMCGPLTRIVALGQGQDICSSWV